MTETTTEDGIPPLTTEAYDTYWQHRVETQNEAEGCPERNDPAHIPNDGQISPHTIGTCHRKQLYRRFNAPGEERDPHGIFWQGTQFETEAILPFLEDYHDEEHVANDLEVDYHPEDNESVRITGTADPTLLDQTGSPVLQTEVKSQSSGALKKDSPSRHHRLQLTAYMAGLGIEDGVLAYVDRTTNRVNFLEAPFTTSIYQDVINWATTHSEHVRSRQLPPQEPEADWECQYCEFRERCGKGDSDGEDLGWQGFVPGIDYPRPKVVEHLNASDGVSLTPTLANEYPDLAADNPVRQWVCDTCEQRFEYGTVGWNGDTSSLPQCPSCTGDDPPSSTEETLEEGSVPRLAVEDPAQDQPPVETGDVRDSDSP
jgi:CRISPR-associated exonuclease Cas4